MALDFSPIPCRVLQFTLALLVLAQVVFAQQSAPPPAENALAESVKQLQQQVDDLRAVVTELKSESQRYRTETQALRRELKSAIEQRQGSDQQAMLPDNPVETQESGKVASASAPMPRCPGIGLGGLRKSTSCSAAKWTINIRLRLKVLRNIACDCRESRSSISSRIAAMSPDRMSRAS